MAAAACTELSTPHRQCHRSRGPGSSYGGHRLLGQGYLVRDINDRPRNFDNSASPDPSKAGQIGSKIQK